MNEYQGLLASVASDSFTLAAVGLKSALPKMINRTRNNYRTNWARSDSGIPTDTVLSLLATSDGAVWAATANKGAFVSADTGESWSQQSLALSYLRARLIQQQEVLLIAGRGSGFGPILHVSPNAGRTWSYGAIVGVPEVDGGTVVGAAVLTDVDENIIATVDGSEGHYAVVGNSDRGPFRIAKSFAARADVIVSPTAPTQILVFADSLYRSQDLGVTWESFPCPGMGTFGLATVDWSTGRIYCWVQRAEDAEVFQVCDWADD
jgi:hypothetical protein